MSDALNALISCHQGFTEAAAGCGKTHLIGLAVADGRMGRQLVLTHTHAGVAAIKRRLSNLGVAASKYHLDTIAGWCLKYAAAYPSISGLPLKTQTQPEWAEVYPATKKVVQSSVGRKILSQSYKGVLVDEYQDCTPAQHSVILELAATLPCRVVGDPMQAIFNFRNESTVTRRMINDCFQSLPPLLHPWRWNCQEGNSELGQWLIDARQELARLGRVIIGASDPVNWVRHDDFRTASRTCRRIGYNGGSTVAILKFPNQCASLAKALGGQWPVVERFDDPDMMECARVFAKGNGANSVLALYNFLKPRMTKVGTDLKTIINSLHLGRSTDRIRKFADHLQRLTAFVESPTPMTALVALEGILVQGDWHLYRQECVFQFRMALRACIGQGIEALAEIADETRSRARHRGRASKRRTIGTPLLVKGLEFDHSILLWEPDYLSLEGLYVGLTRASKSLTVVSRSRELVPSTR